MRPRFCLDFIDQSLRVKRLHPPWIEGGTPRYSIARFGINSLGFRLSKHLEQVSQSVREFIDYRLNRPVCFGSGTGLDVDEQGRHSVLHRINSTPRRTAYKNWHPDRDGYTHTSCR